jgi:6-pyruvoyltetrahydropterin/6-carboxytetrahydropterin synthase
LVPADIITVPFNPTAENMARYLVEEVAVDQLAGTGCVLVECKIEETRKCSASYSILK